MKLHIPSHLLFIAAIILDRVAISAAQISLHQSLRVLVILLFAGCLAAWILQYFLQDWYHTQFIVLMVPVVFVVYRSVYGFFKTSFPLQATNLGIGLMLVLGLLYTILVHRRVWKTVRNPAQVTAYFNIVFFALLSFQVMRLGQGGYDRFIQRDSQTSAIPVSASTLNLGNATTPDIYVIVLDGYARQDVLENIYNHDNSEFISQLEERGFYVASDSHSNYVQTAYTMASFWNMEYIQPWNSSSEYAQYLFEPIQNNRVFRALDEIGYTTVSLEGALHYTEIRNSDVYLSNSSLPINNFETLLLTDSPIEPLSDVFDLKLPLNTYKTHYQRILYQLDTLKQIPDQIPGPKIVYSHILAAHPPFAFSEDGSIREDVSPFDLGDGTAYQGSADEYWNGYRDQVKFINKEILKVTDNILAKSETPPIILVMGDHGPASMFSWHLDDPGCIWERTSNLYAILLPGHQDDGTVYPSISPVNTFRVIFDTYFGTDLPLLEDRSHLMAWQQPTLNLDITTQRDSLAGCTITNE